MDPEGGSVDILYLPTFLIGSAAAGLQGCDGNHVASQQVSLGPGFSEDLYHSFQCITRNTLQM